MGLTWTCAVAALICLGVLDMKLREPARIIDVACLTLGILAILSVIHAEARGVYATRGGRPIRRDDRPDKFRGQSNMQACLGILFIGLGLCLQAWGIYMRVRFGKF